VSPSTDGMSFSGDADLCWNCGQSQRPEIPGDKPGSGGSERAILRLGSIPARVTTHVGHPFVYPSDSAIGAHIHRGQEWDAILRMITAVALREEEPTICEVGGNIGASLVQMLTAKPRAHALTFEPSARFRPFLKLNLELAGFKQVIVSSRLLGRRSDSLWLHNNATSASVVCTNYDGHQPRGAQLVDMTTLDETLRDQRRVDFIKIDTDGYDFEVLRGATATLRRDRPVLYFELAPYLLSSPISDLRWLQSLGYRTFACMTPMHLVQSRGEAIGITGDPEQAVTWANANTYCDVLVFHESSPSQECLARLGFVEQGEPSGVNRGPSDNRQP
jgi:FkbM family methyltransferase